MNVIKKKLIDLIKKNPDGISLDKYIEVCLFGKNGYYNNSQPIGSAGDYITAPEISQLFGEIIGFYIYNFWHKHFRCPFNLIELGPGNGTLISDILRISRAYKIFVNSMTINLIEINQKLINLQKKILKKNNFDINKIIWSNNFDLIEQKPSIIFANEFFDCFATKQFIKINGKWKEKKVNFNDKEKHFYIKNTSVDNILMNNKLDNYATKNHHNNEVLIEISPSIGRFIAAFVSKFDLIIEL